MQVIAEGYEEVEPYVEGELHRQVRGPCSCPKCEAFGTLSVLGYYWRYVFSLCSPSEFLIGVRRFRCSACAVTVSMLPAFAQPHHHLGNDILDELVSGDIPPSLQRHTDMFTGMVKRFGRILDALGPEIDNTLIIFSSDHGEMLGDFGHYGKRTMLDPSARVPMIARLPDHFPANQHCETPATLLDLYPTFLDLAGNDVKHPSPEGINLEEVLKDKAKDRIVFSQFSQGPLGLYMATNRNWKYIYSAADDKEWLYDLANDPLELENCIQDPKSQAQLSLLKTACIERYRSAKNGNTIEGDDWKRYPATEPPLPGTDEGLLFQDPEELDKLIQALGPYARSIEFKKHPQFDLLARLCKISNPETSENTRSESQ